jgi:hypothetical protein
VGGVPGQEDIADPPSLGDLRPEGVDRHPVRLEAPDGQHPAADALDRCRCHELLAIVTGHDLELHAHAVPGKPHPQGRPGVMAEEDHVAGEPRGIAQVTVDHQPRVVAAQALVGDAQQTTRRRVRAVARDDPTRGEDLRFSAG